MKEMTEERRAEIREYKREWRARNKDRIKEYNRRYKERHPDEYRASTRAASRRYRVEKEKALIESQIKYWQKRLEKLQAEGGGEA